MNTATAHIRVEFNLADEALDIVDKDSEFTKPFIDGLEPSEIQNFITNVNGYLGIIEKMKRLNKNDTVSHLGTRKIDDFNKGIISATNKLDTLTADFPDDEREQMLKQIESIKETAIITAGLKIKTNAPASKKDILLPYLKQHIEKYSLKVSTLDTKQFIDNL